MQRSLDQLLAQLSMEEKADLVTGEGIWTTRAVERADVPQLTVTDGPNGARGAGLLGTGTPTACIPSGSVLGATWDVELVERLGELLGDESRAKGANVLLAPTINLHRHSLGGRNFECYSEDPVLSGKLAVGFVRGVQSRQVATTPKHFAVNDSEYERNSIDVQVDERTLRELYLLPFEMAVREGGAWGLMSAYNRLNGTFCSEHEWLLTNVLRDDWGFDGFVVSDWFALRSTAPSLNAGLSLEMPGPGRWYGREKIMEALTSAHLDESQLDKMALDVLRVLERTGAFDGLGGGPEETRDLPEDRALMRRAAAAGTVMLRNDGLLPLDPSGIASIAMIGPNARHAKVMGGGSAKVMPYRVSSPLTALTERLASMGAGADVSISWARGCNIARSVEPLGVDQLVDGLEVSYFSGATALESPDPTPAATRQLDEAELVIFGAPLPEMEDAPFSIRATGTVRVATSGAYKVRMVQAGRARVLIDGEPVIDATEGTYETGDSFFGFGTVEIQAPLELVADQDYELVIEYTNKSVVLLAGVIVGLSSVEVPDLMAEAVALAVASDVAVVVVGTNDDWETEGRDRDQFALPGDQPELIRRVAAANPRTIVVVNTGGPHALDWLELPAAVLQVGFGGQELGEALVDVLLGDADPGGRMPYTVPAHYALSPALPNYPGENSVVRYGEGLLIGHRWFDARQIAPAAVLGEGLSYATFDWATPTAPPEAAVSMDSPVQIVVPVTNTSDRPGSDVVQIYVEPPSDVGLDRPVRELKGFAKVDVAPGATADASISLDARCFAYYDPADAFWAELESGGPVPAGVGAIHRSEPGWYVEPGVYHLVIARSASDHVFRVPLTLAGSQAHRMPA